MKRVQKFLTVSMIALALLITPFSTTLSQHLTCDPYTVTYGGKTVWFTLQFDGKSQLDVPATPLSEMDNEWWNKLKELNPTVNQDIYAQNKGAWVVIQHSLDWIEEGQHSVIARAKIGTGVDEVSDPTEAFQFTKAIPPVPTDIGFTNE